MSDGDTRKIPAGFTPAALGGDFIRANGPLYLKHRDGKAWLGFHVEARHTNPAGILHGGMMASFCDMLLPICGHYQSPELARRFLPTISLQVDYLAPSRLGAWIEGEAQVLRTTTALAFIQGLVSADGDPVARASGVFKIGPVFERPAPQAGLS